MARISLSPLREAIEFNSRSDLFDAFLQPAHGSYEALAPLHLRARDYDPIFYAHLSSWYLEHGAVRDHHELFAATLLLSQWNGHRDQGRYLLQFLRPYQLARMVRWVKKHHFVPRAMRTAIKFYLRRREKQPDWFDECVIRDRQSMKYLYAVLRLAPSRRAEAILFGDAIPADSRVAVVRQLAGLRSRPDLQAELIRRNHIHYTTAVGLIGQRTPSLVEALVEVMTPQQLINNLRSLQSTGALGRDSTRELIATKLHRGVTESRVNDLKAVIAMLQVDLDPDLALRLFRMTENRLRQRGRLTRPTALLVDKSGSMEAAIEVGKLMAAMLSCVAEAPLYVEAFDGLSFTVSSRSPGLGAWTEAFRPIRASGCTSIGAPLHKLRNERLEQVVVITDGEENTAPYFADTLKEYERRWNRQLDVFVVKIGRGNSSFELDLVNMRRRPTTFNFKGDYYNLPNLLPMLCEGPENDLLARVLEQPLYRRADLDHLPPGFDPETCEVL